MDWDIYRVFDRINGYVYLIDAETYRVLYANAALKRLYGEAIEGRLCFEVFQGQNAPCSFCPNEKVLASPKRVHFFEWYHEKLGRHFYCMDFALDSVGNRKGKLEIAIDITEAASLRSALEEFSRLFLSLTHDYETNIEKILRFVLEKWQGREVAYRNADGEVVVVREGEQIFTPQTWRDILAIKERRTVLRLKKDGRRILVFRVGYEAALGIIRSMQKRPVWLGDLHLIVVQLLSLEEGQRREKRRWFNLFDRSPDLLFLVAEDGTIAESNTRVREILGWEKESLVGQHIETLFGAGIWPMLLARVRVAPSSSVEIDVLDVHETWFHFEARISLFGEHEGKFFYLVALRDIGERKKYESVLLKFALCDQLTGLYNRHFLEEYLAKELARCKREGYPLSIAMVDVDSFKKINDFYGHIFGDEVLKMVAKTMQETVRASDIVARYGGDEFILVLPRAGEDEALLVMERLVKRLRSGQIQGEPFSVAISYGVHTWDGQKNVTELFHEIDHRMYAMKKRGSL